MKKKIIALIICLCMCFSTFAGCSLLTNNTAYSDNSVIAKIGNVNITYSELLEKYNTYSQYFAYYDEDVVMKVIYDELYLSKIQELEAEKVVVLTQEDEDEIWEDVFEAVISEIDGYEKTYIENAGKTVPERLSSNSEETTTKKYEEYEFKLTTPITYDEVAGAAQSDVDAKIVELKNKIYDGVGEFLSYRTKAYDKYVATLMYNYKLDGTTLNSAGAL